MVPLPDEVLSSIFQHLAKSDLFNVALASVTFAKVATPFIYENFECMITSHLERRRVKKFIETLITNPQLAQYVKFVDFYRYDPDIPHCDTNPDLSFLASDFTDERFAALVADAQDFVESAFLNSSRRSLAESSQDALKAVVLALVPNLEALRFRMSSWKKPRRLENPWNRPDHGHTLTMQVIQPLSIRSSALGFRSLTEIILYGPWPWGIADDETWNFHAVSVVLRLPTLRTLHAFGCHDLDQSDTWACDFNSSNLKGLYLDSCNLSSNAIANVLRSCRALEIFECALMCCSHPGFRGSGFRALADPNNTANHAHSLKRLVLSNGCNREVTSMHEPLGSLLNFHGLVELEINEGILYGDLSYNDLSLTEVMPQTVERVVFKAHLKQDQSSLFLQIGNLLFTNEAIRSFKVEFANWGDDNKTLAAAEAFPSVCFIDVYGDGGDILCQRREEGASGSSVQTSVSEDMLAEDGASP